MRKNIFLTLLAGTISFVMYTQPAFAHEGMEHGGMHMDESMAQQHRMMAIYAQAQAKIKGALQNGDTAIVEAETRKLLATIPELKKITPHKKLKERGEIVRIAVSFEADLKTTAARAGKGDIQGARESFRKVEKRCAECHRRFRD